MACKATYPLILGTLIAIWALIPAAYSCSWSFNWSCSDCARIGGATSGSQGPYASQSACEAARSQVHGSVTAYGCQSSGSCGPGAGSSGTTGPDPLIDFSNPGAQDWQTEMDRIDREAERPTHDPAATDDSAAPPPVLKPSIPDFDGRKESAAPALKLKSGTPAFGIKPNPAGQIKKQSDSRQRPTGKRSVRDSTDMAYPASEQWPDDVALDERDFRPLSYRSLKIKPVPPPAQVAKGSYLRFLFASSTDLILDALETGDGDLDVSIRWLEGQIAQHNPSDLYGQQALSYLEGLHNAYIAADEAFQKAHGSSEPALLQAILAGSEHSVRQSRSSTPDWKKARVGAMLDAMKAADQNIVKAFVALRQQGNKIGGRNAGNGFQYLMGTYAYWSFLEQQK